MKQLFRELFTSKKFVMAMVGVIVAIGTRYGLQLDPISVGLIVSPIVAAIAGQAVQDNGESAAKMNAAMQMVTDGRASETQVQKVSDTASRL